MAVSFRTCESIGLHLPRRIILQCKGGNVEACLRCNHLLWRSDDGRDYFFTEAQRLEMLAYLQEIWPVPLRVGRARG